MDTGSVKVNAKSGQMLKKNIVFFGNSITAGYGLEPSESFPAQIQSRLDSLHLPYQVVNAGVSGETSADGVSRIDWILQQPVFIFVLELGGNDGLRGIPPDESKKNLDTIIVRVRRKYPDAKIIVAGMKMPPSMGQRYTQQFQNIFSALARKNNALLLPFLLEGVGGIDSLNQKDGIHPTATGARIVAENVWSLLKPLL
jgi:acyl-CoA thioesterase-1